MLPWNAGYVTETSQITFKATELIDKELNAYSCSGYTTAVVIVYDDAYIGDAPKMSVLTECDEAAEKVYATIVLEDNAHLGAGDFSLTFDPAVLTFSSYEQKISADFFLVNDKELADGVFKFSIISLTDIDTACEVIRLEFDVPHLCEPQAAVLDLSGSMMVDSLTNTIPLNLIDGNVTLSDGWVKGHVYDDACDVDCNACGAIRQIAMKVLAYAGSSVSADVNGLAFLFNAYVSGARVENGNEYVTNSASVVPYVGSESYRVVRMGAVVSNQTDAILDMEHVDGEYVIDVEAVHLWGWRADAVSFAIRIIDIPDKGKDTVVTARPYYVYEVDGEEIVVYGAARSATYNSTLA